MINSRTKLTKRPRKRNSCVLNTGLAGGYSNGRSQFTDSKVNFVVDLIPSGGRLIARPTFPPCSRHVSPSDSESSTRFPCFRLAPSRFQLVLASTLPRVRHATRRIGATAASARKSESVTGRNRGREVFGKGPIDPLPERLRGTAPRARDRA